jgi:integrase/recombinase XerC
MFLLSLKSGLRAKEVACVTWGVVTDAEGEIADVIALENKAAKGKSGGRVIPLHPDLKAALTALHQDRAERARADLPVIHSERDRGLSAGAVAVWFFRLYSGLGMVGCSSHSGRRTFITRAARKIGEVGGSLRDIQQLAGHSSMSFRAFVFSSYAAAGDLKIIPISREPPTPPRHLLCGKGVGALWTDETAKGWPVTLTATLLSLLERIDRHSGELLELAITASGGRIHLTPKPERLRPAAPVASNSKSSSVQCQGVPAKSKTPDIPRRSVLLSL